MPKKPKTDPAPPPAPTLTAPDPMTHPAFRYRHALRELFGKNYRPFDEAQVDAAQGILVRALREADHLPADERRAVLDLLTLSNAAPAVKGEATWRSAFRETLAAHLHRYHARRPWWERARATAQGLHGIILDIPSLPQFETTRAALEFARVVLNSADTDEAQFEAAMGTVRLVRDVLARAVREAPPDTTPPALTPRRVNELYRAAICAEVAPQGVTLEKDGGVAVANAFTAGGGDQHAHLNAALRALPDPDGATLADYIEARATAAAQNAARLDRARHALTELYDANATP